MPTAPVFSVDDFLSAFQKLMPRGAAWNVDPESIQAKTERGLVAAWHRVNVADLALLVDAFPATSVNLLPEWESTLGLPDPCAGDASTISERQKQVVAKLTNSGGASAQYFIEVAAALGYEITITTNAPFRAGQSHAGDPLYGDDAFYTWTVHAPLSSTQHFRAGAGRAGDPLATWGNDVLECVIEALAPAHTDVIFVYGEEIAEGWEVDFTTGKFWVRPIGGTPQVGAFSDFWTTTRASVATYRNAAGMLATAANNVPRVESAGDGTLSGLLIEKAGTNLTLRSGDLANAVWGPTNATVAANAALAPDGTMTATKITASVGVGFHYLSQATTVVNGATYCTSAFFKKGELNFGQVQFGGAAFSSQFCRADLTTGVFAIGNGAVAGGVEKFADGWFRLWVMGVASGVGTGGGTLVLTSDLSGTSFNGDGVSGLYAWGGQLELASLPTSYVATLGAAVTRAADRITRNLGAEFTRQVGTLFAECALGKGDNDGNQFIISNNDATFTNSATLFAGNDGAPKISINSGGGFAGLAFMGSPMIDRAMTKLAGAWQLDDAAMVRNGVLGTPDATAPVPLNLTRVDLGSTFDGSNACERVWIRRAFYKPVRSANADLVAITT